MAVTPADVPGRFDVVINGQGYVLLDSIEPSLPFRSHRATYGYTPPFITRQNVSSGYGDNTQDYFLTDSQNDWSLGEGQQYYRTNDAVRDRRYYSGTAVDPVSVPGQVALRNTVGSLTFAAAVRCCAEQAGGAIYAASSTNLYSVDSTGSITDRSAHGLGANPSQWGITADPGNVFLTTTTAGTVGVRRWNGSAYSTFSATGCDSLAFLNNTLFGYSEATGSLIKYDTAGSVTTLFTWKDSAGNALTGSTYATRLRAYGGKLLMLRKLGVRRSGELWQYDGTNVSQLADFPANFVAQDMEVVDGIVFVAGYLSRNSDLLPAIYYYVNSTIGLLWKSNVGGYTSPTWPAMAAYGDGLAFTDDTTGSLMQYNIAVGGVHTMGAYTVTNATALMAANKDVLLHTRNAAAAYYFPTTTLVSSGTVISSLFDFENSLIKQFRGIRVDCSLPTGSTFDIAYQTDSTTGSWTNLQTGAVSGQEYTLSGVSGRSLAVRTTLNKGASATSPALRRTYVRAAPQLPQFRQGEYILDCTNTATVPRKLRDNMYHPKTGYEQMRDLVTAANATTPFSVTDRVGTFTGFIDLNDPDGFDIYEMHPATENPAASGSYIIRLKVRQV